MKRMKRAIALLLAAAMCFSVCPTYALASMAGVEAEVNVTPDPEQNAIEQSVAPAADAQEPVVPATEPSTETVPEEEPEEPTVSEVEIVASGNCSYSGSSVAWSLDTEGTIRITGTGKMQNYSNGTYTPWYPYRDQVVSVVVEEGVTSVGNLAFYVYYPNLKEISLPNTLISIGNQAFRGCAALTEVVLPESLTSMGTYVFYQCTGLTEIVLPDGITSISNYLFYGCTNLTSVTLPANLTSVGQHAFQNCTGLTEVALPESLTEIRDCAFYGCSGLAGTLVIPDEVTFIGTEAYENCTGLTGLVLNSKLTTIDADAFYGCKNITGELVIPDSVTSIRNRAFYNLAGVTSIVFGAGLTEIGTYTDVYYNPFGNCSGVQYITFTGQTAPAISCNIFTNMSKLESVTVPAEGYASYANAFGIKLPSKVRIRCSDWQDDMMIVDNVLVAYLGEAKSVVIPEGVTAIGDGAFLNCSALTSVVIPDSVTAIGNYAFARCTGLTELELPDGLTRIGKYAFYGCQKMEAELNFSDSLTELGEYAFYNCVSITGPVYLSDAITKVEQYIFYNCTGLNGTLRLPANLTEIKPYAFYRCTGLAGELVFPETLTTIGASAFIECKSFTGDLKIGDSVTSISGSAFSGCSGFNGTLTLSEGLSVIRSSTFRDCSGFTGELVIPDSVTSLESAAFSGMKGLNAVVVGSGVTSYNYPFSNCSNLVTITFTGLTVPTISSSNPFSGMTKLKTIYVPAGLFSDYLAKFGSWVPATAAIIGTGIEGDFLIEDNVLLSYQGAGGEVVIPDHVTSIGTYAFQGRTEVTEVTIPDSVTTIGNYAFRNCTGLTHANLPSGIQIIGESLFTGCTGLTGELVIPDGVTRIGNMAFQGCIGLTGELVIPDSVTFIAGYAFQGCTGLTGVNTGNGVETIGNYAFEGCTGLMNVVIGDSMTSIAERAFEDCSALTTLDLGSSVQSIGSNAFYNCTSLTGDLVIPDSVTSLGSYVFYGCTGLNGTLTLSKGLTSIPGYAFYGCKNITGELLIPDSVEMIHDDAFEWMTGITSIVLGSGLTQIGTSTSASLNPFYFCTGATAVTFTGETPPVIKSNMFSQMQKLETIYVPLASFAAYSEVLAPYRPANVDVRAIGAESDFLVEDGVLVGYLGADTEVTIPENVTGIGASVFQNNAELTAVVIPDTVTSIGDYAFSGCKALTAVELPDALTEIGSHAFYNCTGLTGQLALPDALTSIGPYCFYGCTGLTGELVLPEGLEEIPEYAFHNCSNLSGELVIPNSVRSIGNRAFYNLKKVTSITIGTGLETSGTNTTASDNPFSACSAVTEVTFLGETPPVFKNNMFYSMTKLATVYVPAESYGEYAAAIMGNLTNGTRIRCLGETEEFLIDDGVLVAYLGDEAAVQIPEGITAIGDAAFLNNTAITSVVIPDSVTVIGAYAFRGCKNLSGTLDLPEQVTSIGMYAFGYCAGLTGDLIIPDSVTELGSHVFYSCTGLNGTLKLPAGITAVKKSTFYSCSKIIGEVVIPDSVTKIEDFAFQSMSSITSVVIGSGITQIDVDSSYNAGCFYSCTNLKNITFTGKLPTLRNSNPYMSLTKLETIHVPKAEFASYLDKLDSMLPATTRLVTMEMEEEFLIDDGVLMAYQGVGGDVVIPDGVTDIGTCAFHGCEEVTSVTIPEGVATIGAYAFYSCSGLTRIDLPNSLKNIEQNAFRNCDGLTGTLVIPDKVQSIGPYAFYDCDGITALDFGSGLTSIGDYAFKSCSALTGDLVLPDSLTTLGYQAFQECLQLNGTLKLSESMTDIPTYAFYKAPLSGELVIPDSVSNISGNAFYDAKGLESIVIGAGVTQISSSNPFYGCSGVRTVMFMGSEVPNFGTNIFAAMSNLETVYVLAEAYDAYVAAISSWLGENVVISTDFISAKINNLAADRVYSKTVVLSWSPHTSDSVVGYRVFLDGEVIADTTDCAYAIRELEPERSYTFTVQGYAEDGRVTGASQVTATTVLPEIRDIKTVSSVNKINEISNTISIYAVNSGNLLPLDRENTVCALYCDGVHIGDAVLDQRIGNQALYTLDWDMTGWEDGEHEVRVCLTDIDGASAEYSETLIIDRGIPAQIVGVTAVGDVNVLHINWAMAVETDTNIYRIYRRTETDSDYRLIAQINNRNTLSYTDRNIKNDRVYYYYVVGVNELNQEGVPSLVVAATLAPDIQAPVVTKLSPANGTYLRGVVTLQVTAQDDIALHRAELSYSRDDGATWTFLSELSAGAFRTNFDTTVLDDGEIRIRAIAFDAAGNASTPLEYVYAIDNHGPEKVRGLSYESTNVSITLRWSNVSDVDIWYYRVEQKGDDGTYTKVGDVYDTLGMNIYDLTPGTEYTYRVVGYDQHGNRGTPSEDIAASTLSDTIPPVITRIRPTAGYYAEEIPLVITAEDEYQLRSITIQISADLLSWSDVYVQNYAGTAESQILSYDLDLSGQPEGTIYVRAVARDRGGNTSDTSVNAPYVQYIIDRTAPAVPADVKAIGQCGYIEISWTQGAEADLNGYCIYRAEAEDGTYTLLAEGLKSINYYDRTAAEDTVYYYKVAVTDMAGNQSECSDIVFAEVGEDTEAPVIVAIYPTDGSLMGSGNNGVSVTATDNHMLQSLLIEYSADGVEYKTMYELPDISQHGEYADARVPVSEFSDGDVVYLRASAADRTGNISAYSYVTYIIDAVAPVARNAEAVYSSEDETVLITWTGCMEADLYGYRIYRVVKDTETLVGFCPAVAGQSDYGYVDANLPVEKTTCTYKVIAVDACGNPGGTVTGVVEIPDRQFPRVILYCDNTMEVGVEYVFDASASTDNESIVSYAFDFGDGTTSTEPSVIHAYQQIGEYTVTLTVTDNDGHVSTSSKTITVVERSAIGTVKIQIVDENGRAVPNAPVYFDLGEPTQTMKLTDSTGCAIFTSTAGVHSVGCVIPNNEWLPAKKDVIILAGAQTTVPMTLVHQPMIEGVFEVNRMTFEEIVAAGIDVSKPENQHIVSVGVKLTYGSVEQEASFLFNMVTKEAIGDMTYDRDNDGAADREIVPVLLSEKSIAYLDLPIGASLLKEFFDVRLTIINNASSEFSMLDNVITLNLPEGLSIVEAAGAQSSAAVEIGEIPGQTSTTISWILRGDQEGEYSLSADYSGRLSQFDEPIHTTFLSKEPIRVYGLSAVKLIAEVNSSINFDAFYFNLALENVSSVDVNLPSIQIEDHVLTAYLSRVYEFLEEDGTSTGYTDPTVSEPEVRHLNTILSSASGYRQYIGTETTVQTLAAGEKLTNQYAAYNVTGYNNLMLLQEAIYEIADSYGIRFELIETDMDLFSTDHAADKLADIAGNDYKRAQFDEILDCSRYFYVLESLDRNTSSFVRTGEALYSGIRQYLAIDSRYDAEATAEVTRAIVAQLMVDESMQQAIETAVDGKYLEVTAVLLEKIGALLTDVDTAAWSSCMEAENRVRTLADKLEKFGLERFVDHLTGELKASGVSEAGIALIRGWYEDGQMTAALSEAVAGVCTLVAGTVEKLDAVSESWCETAAIVTDLIRVAAAQQELDLLLDMLLDHTVAGGSIHTALERIRTGLEDIEDRLAQQFAESLDASLAEGTETTAAILGCLDSVYGAGTGPSYTLVKLAFGSVGDVLTWDGVTTDRHVLSMCTEIGLALRQAVEQYGPEAETDGQAVYTLTALKYLIKMRLIGEQCFVNAMGHLGVPAQADALVWINGTNHTDYESLQAYLSALQVRLLTYRDNIFASYYTNLDIPAAPTVTIDYRNGATVETFSSDYEYSFEGSVWQDCNGEAISFTPTAANRYLWVRVKGTESGPAGNIAKVVIPAMPRITGDITMIYMEGGYQISGLSAGTYRYAFTDEKTDVTLTGSITVTDGEIIRILEEHDRWTYIALGTDATETAFASQLRYVVAERPWVIDTDTHVITGREEQTTALQLVYYYEAKGYMVTVVDADGNATELVGTGCVINLDGKAHTAVVSGDVDGDAEITMEDLFKILNHINSDEELKDAYFRAGLICENEDIDLFDLWAELTHINSKPDPVTD